MRVRDVNRTELVSVLADMPAVFRTKDVSNHPRMLAAHDASRSDLNYHAIVGRALGQLAGIQGSRLIRAVSEAGNSQGELWQQLMPGTTQRSPGQSLPPSPGMPAPNLPMQASNFDLGPQFSGDSLFRAKLRRHQSWYRAYVLRVPCGTEPRQGRFTTYGNMLTRADGERGLNFLTPQIFEVVRRRIQSARGAVEPFRLLHNMLSSQPMCFNLFGPLVDDIDLATMLIHRLLPGQIDRVLRVEIEFAPEPASDYLADRTAFDAFVEYRRPDGYLGCLGIETKLSERFSPRHYDRPAYRRWMQYLVPTWRPEAPIQLDAVRHNQLWRDHLLAVAMRYHPRSCYAETGLLLIRHPLDTACAATAATYRTLLGSADVPFIDYSLDQIVDLWMGTSLNAAQANWLGEFHRRYLDLAASAEVGEPRVHAAGAPIRLNQ